MTLSVSGQTNGWRMERERIERLLPPGYAVNVYNPCGDIRCRKLKDHNVAVFAVVQTPPNALLSPQITLSESAQAVHVCVVPPPAPPGEAASATPRVDLTVYIPADAPLNLSTIHGIIEAKGIRQAVVAETESGSVTVHTSGPLAITTTSGSITAILKSKEPWSHPVSVESVTGDISLRLPRYPDIVARLRSAGRISVDYSTQVQSAHDSHIKQITARISEGRSGTRGWWGRLFSRIVHPARPVHSMQLHSQRGDIDLMHHFPDWRGGEQGD